jgi:hypothetical protein
MKTEILTTLFAYNTPEINYVFWRIVEIANINETRDAIFNQVNKLIEENPGQFAQAYNGEEIYIFQIDYRNRKPFESPILKI